MLESNCVGTTLNLVYFAGGESTTSNSSFKWANWDPRKKAAEESTAAENFRSLSSVTEAIASDIESASYDGYQDVLPKMNLDISWHCLCFLNNVDVE